MRVAVVGGGFSGLATAHALRRDGHEVCLIERHAAVAAEGSFAQAGLDLAELAAPFPQPSPLGRLFPRNWAAGGGFQAPLLTGWTHHRWSRLNRAARRPQTLAALRSALYHLQTYSRTLRDRWSEALGLEFEQGAGITVLMREAKDLARHSAWLPSLREWGASITELAPNDIAPVEPGLRIDPATAGAWHLPRASVTNGRQFAQLMRDALEQQGVECLLATEVLAIEGGTRPGLVTRETPRSLFGERQGKSAPTDEQLMHFDAIVLCTGAQALSLLTTLGLRLPLQTFTSYSLSAPLRDAEHAPLSAIYDATRRVAIARLGNRVRVSGCVTLGEQGNTVPPRAMSRLQQTLHDWFPGAAHLQQQQPWVGRYLALPDGLPVVDRAPGANIWLNIGHGDAGWASACGCAQVVADLLSRRPPEIDATPLRLERWQHTN